MYNLARSCTWAARPPTNTAEIIDLNQPSPAWRHRLNAFARRQMNATMLPTARYGDRRH